MAGHPVHNETRRFRRTPATKVQPLLATLVALSLLRETEEGVYAG
ncbi:hypothetical protein [Hymenobacter amundsenii]|nr:hypothetical protein [Hymenobacter amundsenii]